MRIAIAPDSFKGTLSAMEAAEEIERGLRRALPGLETVLVPVADGGEGTVESVADALDGRLVEVDVHDPLGRPRKASLAISGDGTLAVLEMASASGLPLLAPDERNPLKTCTQGTGDLIKYAMDRGVKKILAGIGGSATNDAGTGMARVLGFRFLDADGKELEPGGGSLGRLARIDAEGKDPRLSEVEFEIACDVDNPLTGPKGASRVFGPQKGATAEMVETLDGNLANFAAIVKRDLGADILEAPGAGAAGGLGGGFMAFCGGSLRSGAEMVTEAVELGTRIDGCDLVITGEGRMDSQTAHGKTPAGVAAVARTLGIPVIAICGSAGPGIQDLQKIGIEAVFDALPEPISDGDLPKRAPEILATCAEQVGRLIALMRS